MVASFVDITVILLTVAACGSNVMTRECCVDKPNGAAFKMEGCESSCVDINECTIGTADCVDGSTCDNTDGSFTCTCPSGFRGDGRESGSGCRETLARNHRQVDEDELVQCFVDQNCLTVATPLNVTRRECCLLNPAGAGFRIEGEETCNVCVVFGFFQSTFTASEQNQLEGYSISVGYLKRPRPNNVLALPFTVSQELLNTTTLADFNLQTIVVVVLPNQDSQDVNFTFSLDGIALELDETVRLRLSVFQAILGRLAGELNNSVYFLDTADLVIVDSDSLEIEFTEEDYRNGEATMMLPVRVNKNQRIATPVTVRVTPSTLTQHRLTGRDDPPGTLEDDPNSPIEADLIDFNNTAIEVTFQPDETGDQMDNVDALIGIIDDVINEANEQYFVVTLEIVSAFNTSRITIVREESIGRISDDDAISIGFQQPSYNLDEPTNAGDAEDIVGVVLLEKENGVVSEQTFFICVTVIPPTPNQTIQPAELSTDIAANDYTIGPNNFVILRMDPEEQTEAFNFRLFGDDVAEGTEAFQATSTKVEDTPWYFPSIRLSPSTFIIIKDRDVITIGFETNCTVVESVGTVEICAVPVPTPTIPILADIFLSVNTIPGTANEMDYVRIAESDGTVFLQFNNMNRSRQCFFLEIINDDELEDTESLTIDLVFSSFSPPPSDVILDPDVITVTILDNDVVNCDELMPPVNSNIVYSNSTMYNSTATYVCDIGFVPEQMENQTTRICRDNGQWSGSGVKCVECPEGFRGNGTVCNDINECINGSHSCVDEGHCNNTDGSFTCTCPSGFENSDQQSCRVHRGIISAVVIVGVILLLIFIVLVVLTCRRKYRTIKKKQYAVKQREKMEMENLYAGGVVLSSVGVNATGLSQFTVQSSKEFVKDIHKEMLIYSSHLKIQESIGQGEFGIVYKGHLLKDLGQTVIGIVAIKTLKGFFDELQVDNLLRECLKMQQFDHPNVLKLTGVCMDGGPTPFLVMPFMANGSLHSYLKRNRSSLVISPDNDDNDSPDNKEAKEVALKRLVDMCLQVARGMEYLASKRVIHRDLASRNCMIDINFVIKVADFGLAQQLESKDYFRLDKGSAVKLPVKWLALESLVDSIFSEKTDVWAYGVTCWEIFSGGKTPYPSINPSELVYKLETGYRMEKPNNAACSDELYSAMLQCWSSDPTERPIFSELVERMSLYLESMAGYLHIGAFGNHESQTHASEEKPSSDPQPQDTSEETDIAVTSAQSSGDNEEVVKKDVKDIVTAV